MAQLPTGIVSHSQKVCSLYKRALLCLKAYYHDRLEFRYQAVKLRQRFDKNARIADLRLAKHLLHEGEEELFYKEHPQPFIYPDAPGGVAYNRDPIVPDSLLDKWHPIEKAMYPKYFARREQRKKEYLEWYYKQYPQKKPVDDEPY
ncbi:PREDICTED: NADH dehydrogenase [ubiquinone] 1 beta subcomplex subunit 9 [Polistes dominula]|uniref:NADH dehydrogenase [ubiquinone] 1 beta subcomplex subunit 9 n=1 Tax=Polistes dominula TaxID=743375 RepID=A0ABM1I0C2_POLDO|nr:PREDICTED: NADH dehydrogenase [ubiquinone] 1 beta subcomplex subunit 9 [Polistes dominula]